MSEPASTDGRSPASPPQTWWSRNGFFIWMLGAFAVAGLVRAALPDSYDRALDFVSDAVAVVCWLAITAGFLRVVVRDRRTATPLAYLLAALLVAVAALMAWNLTANSMDVGIQPISLLGWGESVRPSKLFLPAVLGMLCLVLAAAGVQRLRRRPSH